MTAAKSKLGTQREKKNEKPPEPKTEKVEAKNTLSAESNSQITLEIGVDVSEQTNIETKPRPDEELPAIENVGEIPQPSHIDDTPLGTDISPERALRVGQIISTQTSLSKDLQSKLPQVGGVVSQEEQEEEEVVKREEGEEESEAVGLRESKEQVAEAEYSNAEKEEEREPEEVGLREKEESLLSLEKTPSPLSASQDVLPEEFGVVWKQEEDERKMKEEQERAERKKVRSKEM